MGSSSYCAQMPISQKTITMAELCTKFCIFLNSSLQSAARVDELYGLLKCEPDGKGGFIIYNQSTQKTVVHCANVFPVHRPDDTDKTFELNSALGTLYSQHVTWQLVDALHTVSISDISSAIQGTILESLQYVVKASA